MQNWKNKSSKQIQNMKIRHIRAKNGLFALNFFFSFQKPINKPCSCHSCLPTFEKSKSDADSLMKYWRLKKAEISLANSIFGHNLRTWFFPGMRFLQNAKELYKHFHFTPFSNKTKDLIFLKRWKTLFSGHFKPFWSILSNGDFSKKILVGHGHPHMARYTMQSFRKN